MGGQIPPPIIRQPMSSQWVKQIYREGTAENTDRAHKSDLKYFWGWANASGNETEHYPVSSELIIKFITDHIKGLDPIVDKKLIVKKLKRPGKHSITTITRRIRSLSYAHQKRKEKNPIQENPEIRLVLRKARKAASLAGYQPRKKRAITIKLLNKILDTFGNSLVDKRDRAILLFAFATGGRRRSEVAVALVINLVPVRGGFIYWMPRSKTDQEGKGKPKPVKKRAAQALRTWLEGSGIDDGYLFRQIREGVVLEKRISDRTVSDIVKQRVEMCGRDPSEFGGHSLRRGFMTESGRQGIPIGDAMDLSDHKSVQVAMTYYEEGAVLENPAGNLI